MMFPVFTSAVMRPSKTLIVTPISLTNDSFWGSIVSGSAATRVVSSPLGSASAPAPVFGPLPCWVQAATTRLKRVTSAKSGQMRLRVWVKFSPPSPFLLGYGAILGHS
jgi:hypothetical protein